jgi:2-polyprenyl-3-methyl-5-hydroxy-6-metoxy-1,4-benzoquinol methylase
MHFLKRLERVIRGAGMKLNRHTVEAFVTQSDALGGPGSSDCKAFWANLQYQPECPLDLQNVPFSKEYFAQQMALYHEITGHPYLDARDEFTPGVPVEKLLLAPNAYDHPVPAEYAKHCVAMGLVVQQLNLPRGARILELGSGWGFCQEFLSHCGYRTVGIDANPDFVATSNARLSRLGFGERVIHSTFDQFSPDVLGQFDAVLAYEAFHHAVDPYALLSKVVGCMNKNGVFILAAEPFNDYYSSWGLRLDPYSIYCIKKYGWFESGWSIEFMADLFGRCGLSADFVDAGISDLSRFMVGRYSRSRRAFQLQMWHPDSRASFFVSPEFCSSKGRSIVPIYVPQSCKRLSLNFSNFNTVPLRIDMELGSERRHLRVAPGEAAVAFEVENLASESTTLLLKLNSELFCPAQRGINSDTRQLGIHFRSVDFL